MAREDLLADLLISLLGKEDPPIQDDNTLIQKMVAPNDDATFDDTNLNVFKKVVTTLVWGGIGVITNWMWNQGQYFGGVHQKNITPSDTAQLNDVPSLTKHAVSSLLWGGTGITTNWSWNSGQYS